MSRREQRALARLRLADVERLAHIPCDHHERCAVFKPGRPFGLHANECRRDWLRHGCGRKLSGCSMDLGVSTCGVGVAVS